MLITYTGNNYTKHTVGGNLPKEKGYKSNNYRTFNLKLIADQNMGTPI